MDQIDSEPIGNTLEQFASMVRADVECYVMVVRALGIKLD